MEYLHTMVRVADLDRALAFYVDTFGLIEVRRVEGATPPQEPWTSMENTGAG